MSKEKHYSKNDSKLKQFFSILSSFLLSTSLTVLILFSCIKLGFTNTSQITKAFSTSNFYNSVYNTMMSDCENEAIISGLSEEIFDGVFSLNELTSYCNSHVKRPELSFGYFPYGKKAFRKYKKLCYRT